MESHTAKDIFFGRKAYLEVLEKRILALKDGYRQNIAIIGDELVGKTSIVFNFLNNFYDNRFIMLYLEARPESVASFGKRFIAVLLYNFLNNGGVNTKEDLEFLVNKAETYIPKTVGKIKALLADLDKKKKENIFAELLSLCETIHEETQKFCVVIFDEFHNLESLGLKKLYAEWSKTLISQKNTLYIIISSFKFKASNILSRELSLLFGNFEVINVEPFDIRATEGYLEYTGCVSNINGALKDFIVHFTGGYPFYLQVLADCLLKSPEPDLLDILENLLFEPSGILNQRFSNCLKRFQETPQDQQYVEVLYLISEGHNKTKDLAHILRKNKKELDLKVNKLLEMDAVSRSGDFLKINDRIFSFWLKFVYQGKLNSLTFDAKNQKALFRQKIEAMIREFILSAKKPIIERMSELLHLFGDDQIQIERKKLKLNHFREIKSLEFGSSSIKEGLICRSTDSLWIIALKHDMLTEEDITEFSRECKKYRHKLQKRIIVTLRDIDANSRLKAIQEKITTWDINNVNQMLDLFAKPRIIA
ncbi:MAG: ATP-binding protein [Candidatus Omnitrophica bacterium]|nr:ATP-binding protein [Candidatus Omnitrophota bacterium]